MEMKLEELEKIRHTLSVKLGRFMLAACVLLLIFVIMAVLSGWLFLWVAAGIVLLIVIVYILVF